MDILTQIENYRPYNEQEERDKGLILDCLRAFEDVFTRENALAHMTASAWVVNERFDRVLMAYHNIYDRGSAGTPTGKRTCSPSRSGKSARRAASKTSVRQARTFSRLRC